MADENFEKVVDQLGKATKRPTAAKAPAALAVQIVDKSGKVITEKTENGNGDRDRQKNEQAQLSALQDLETSFPQEFEQILTKKGLVGESKHLAQEELLDQIRIGVDGVKLGVIQRFKDSFTNLMGIMPNRAARKRASAADLATALMQADIEDIAKTLTVGAKRAQVEWESQTKLRKIFGQKKPGASEAEAQREKEKREKKTNTLLEVIANKIGIGGEKEKGKVGFIGKGVAIILAALMAPIVILVSFFKQLGKEVQFLHKLVGAPLTKLFAPIKNLFAGSIPALTKFLKPVTTFFKSIGTKIKGTKIAEAAGKIGPKIAKAIKALVKFLTPITNFFKTIGTKILLLVKSTKIAEAAGKIGPKIANAVKALTKFLTPATSFFKTITGLTSPGGALITGTNTAKGILGFAKTFGTVLGKIFLPITILMSAFDFITGFMEGHEEAGILGGLREGLAKVFENLIGIPLDLLKGAVAWILGKMGFARAVEWLNSFSFSELIGGMIRGLFGMIESSVNWIKLIFTDPVAALEVLWDTLTGGIASIMDFIWAPVKAGIAWVMRLFGWDEAAAATETFSISGFINGIFDKIKGWITGIFSWGTGSDQDFDDTSGEDAAGWSLKTFVDTVWGKVKGWFKSLFSWGRANPATSWLFKIIDNVILTVKGWVTGLFAWAATTDEGDSWITTTIKNVVDGVKTWLGDLFSFDSSADIIKSAFNIATFLPNIVLEGLKVVTTWLLSLFGFDEKAKALANADSWSIGGMVVGTFLAVKKWFLGLFGFGGKDEGEMTDADKAKAAEGFSLIGMVKDVVKSIKEFFWKGDGTGLLEFDLVSALPDFDLSGMFEGIGDMFSIDKILGSIGKKIQDTDIPKWIKGALFKVFDPTKALAAGGPFSKGQGVLVGELGPEMILPNQGGQVLNAQRTQQMLQAGMARGMGGGAGGGITSVNTGGNVVSAPTTNYVNNGIAARRPILLTA